MSASDPEATRQAVAQAMARSELPEGSTVTDSEVVSSLYSLMGLNRLVLYEPSVEYFMEAVQSYRQHRTRTSRAWGVIKRGVSASGPSN